MAQFYGGLEETPYDGWTLSGLVACGPRLLLTCPVDGLASTTGWTAATGSLPTVEANRFKWAGTAGNTTVTASPSGLTVGSPVVSGRYVQVAVSGGSSEPGTAYVLTCTVSTSGGATLSQRGGIAMTA